MAVSSGLTGELKKVVLELEDDLRTRVQGDPDVLATWEREHKEAVARERTAMSWQAWRDDRVTQAAVAWVLTTVFVRFCEDNRLLAPVWIAGPPERRQEALDAELEYFRAHPEHTDREWLLQAVEHLGSVRATREFVEAHSPLWSVSPSGQAAKKLVAFWRATDDDGALVHDFIDPDLSTRFLGDLYQDLSDYAKKTFALLQTPEFVEEFILDQTMEPALAERPLDGFRLIDPTCGSGHFLLGAFARLNDRWATHFPGLEVQARVQKALDAIHGVDLNPFAVAIAKFRLIVAALQACGLTSLEDAPGFTLHLAAGDSLLHGGHQLSMQFDGFDADAKISGFTYASEDLALLKEILTPGRYDAVVGNPPYITVKDKILNARYRELYPTCKGTYALTVPFMERFFQLAKTPSGDRPAGWTGQITSNSFMKREFGTKLIEDFLVYKDLRSVVDSEGAWIPGHNTDGTPTVILVGRNQKPVGDTVRTVLSNGKRETRDSSQGGEGPYWQGVQAINQPGYEDEYVSVVDLPRGSLASHPWSLSGGGAVALLGALNGLTPLTLGKLILGIGRVLNSVEDSVLVWDRQPSTPALAGLSKPVVDGSRVRDYMASRSEWLIYGYSEDALILQTAPALDRYVWPFRTSMLGRLLFGRTIHDRDLPAWALLEYYPDRVRSQFLIAFSLVASHTHFTLIHRPLLARHSAPVIQLPRGADRDKHLELAGVLNSSTACFWLKQSSQPKGGAADIAFLRTFEFTGSTVKDFPLPKRLPLAKARSLDETARMMGERFLTGVPVDGQVPSEGRLERARTDVESMRGRMIAVQEELDWEVYQSYGLIVEDLTYGDEPPGLALGERAFEIALARKVAAGEEETVWFTRHGSTPITEIPSHWPEDYRQLVQRRLDLIESHKFIRLLEKPEHKRRWATEPWDKQVERALRKWLLDRLEGKHYWFDAQGRPAPKSVAQLADQVSRDADLVSVLELWSGKKDQSVTASLTALLADESVPFLAAYRFKDSGLRKREAWEHTWDLQRREDAGEKVGDIPVPPKYTSADFRKASWWQHRGKLDVPKERFILYPNAGRETDPTPVLGWAGWDHAQQALALATIIGAREGEGWADERLVPLVAGLAELQPWVTQWHNEVDPTYGVNLAEFTGEHLRDKAAQVGLTVEQLHAWRPAPATRGRRARA